MADDGPALGEQRCHGSCNVGRQPTLTDVKAWEIAGRPAMHTESCHHQPPSRMPVPNLMPLAELRQIAPFIHTSVRVLQITSAGMVDTALDVSPEARESFRATATQWELGNSGILSSLSSAAMPVIDEGNTVVGYMIHQRSTGVHHYYFDDLDGNTIDHQTQEEPLVADELGNELIATVFTLGGALVVRSVGRAVLSRAANAAGKAALRLALDGAEALAPEAAGAIRVFLRSLRAKALVKGFVRRGLKVTVNIGGEGAEKEVKLFGEAINLQNPSTLAQRTKKFIPNLIKEPGENIGDLFGAETVDQVVGNKLPQSLNPDSIAKGAAKVLKPGGKVDINFNGRNSEFARWIEALKKAGFKDVQDVHNLNVQFIATKS